MKYRWLSGNWAPWILVCTESVENRYCDNWSWRPRYSVERHGINRMLLGPTKIWILYQTALTVLHLNIDDTNHSKAEFCSLVYQVLLRSAPCEEHTMFTVEHSPLGSGWNHRQGMSTRRTILRLFRSMLHEARWLKTMKRHRSFFNITDRTRVYASVTRISMVHHRAFQLHDIASTPYIRLERCLFPP